MSSPTAKPITDPARHELIAADGSPSVHVPVRAPAGQNSPTISRTAATVDDCEGLYLTARKSGSRGPHHVTHSFR